MDRRDFIKAAGVVSAWPTTTREQTATPAANDRDVWIGVLRKLGDPVLNNLANGTLKARMPVEQAAGTDRRSVTHLDVGKSWITAVDISYDLWEQRFHSDPQIVGRQIDVNNMALTQLLHLSGTKKGQAAY